MGMTRVRGIALRDVVAGLVIRCTSLFAVVWYSWFYIGVFFDGLTAVHLSNVNSGWRSVTPLLISEDIQVV